MTDSPGATHDDLLALVRADMLKPGHMTCGTCKDMVERMVDRIEAQARELAEIARLRAENERLAQDAARYRQACDRARGCIKGLLARTPVRDVSETLAEIDAALAGRHE